MTNFDDDLNNLLNKLESHIPDIPITQEQAQDAVMIEFETLEEEFDSEFAQQLYLKVLLNSYVDRRFSSEEYADIQNERMIKVATIFNTLLQIFKNDPQSFVATCEVLQVRLPGANTPALSLICNNITTVVGVPTQTTRIPL